ncbi:MAG TPA: acyltransferase [Acidimicrobiia bacterium]|nr:acyltransferase [Acidimicrobiia bacterium]
MTTTREAASAPADAPRAAVPRFAHLRALDGLRGVAVLAVVLYHFAPSTAPGGFLGVDLFFVLSGFLITSLLVSEWEGRRRISLAGFWGRRARRLLPALFLVLVAVGVYNLVATNQVDAHRFASDGLAALVYVANWHFIASGQSYIQQFLHQAASPLRHTWSLAIEEQFYLVWPLVVVALATLANRRSARPQTARRRFRRLLVGACVVLGVASFLRMITLYQPGSDPTRVYEGTDTHAFVILIGAALGALSAGVPIVRQRLRGPLIVLGCAGAAGVLVAMAWVTATSSWLFGGGYGLIVVLLVVVLAAAAQPHPNPLARLLEWRPLVGLGLISYGVYLCHWPVFLWVTSTNTGLNGPGLFVLRCAITLAVSLASYVLVEQPIRRGGLARLGQVRVAVPAAGFATVAVVLLVPLLAFPAVAAPPTTAHLSPGAVDITATYAAAPRCDGGPKPTAIDPGRRLLVQVEGNSIAGEIRPCLTSILAARGGAVEGVNPPGFLLCHEIPAIEAQAKKTHPVAALLFAFVAYDPRCGPPWHWPVDALIAAWKQDGIHVYLVPSVPFVPGTSQAQQLGVGPQEEAEYYTSVALADPAHVTELDAGTFLRDSNGQYVWDMPCLPGGEPGCDPVQHTVGVRYIDGFHFCTDPSFAAHGCVGAEHQAGERRAAASIAAGLLPSLATLTGGRAPPSA